ncbi:LysR family transcriptional regulator [Reyranella sp. CPCC 100927]|nr:LysR family transcriptional regulator [Reyranella sp. CPCC 100927]
MGVGTCDGASMDWDDLKFTLAVARHGSLSAAARALGTTQPTVGRRLNNFERRLGVKLFERSVDGLVTTPLAAALIEGLDEMEHGALAIERRLASRDTGLAGLITLTSIDWLGDHVLAPIAARFAARHPQVQIDLLTEPRDYNLARREADIVFRFGAFEQENVVVRKVADVAYGFYASDSYVQRHGLPDFDNGCRGHAIVLLHDEAGRVCYGDWTPMLAPQARVIFRSKGLQAHFAAVEAGEAMATLPRFVADQRQGLRHIVTPVPEPTQAVRMGVHADMRDTPRLRAFIDFAASALKSAAARLKPAT